MVRRAVLTCLVLSVGIAVAAALVPGIDVTGGFLTYLWLGLLFGLVNAILGPILHILSLPLTVITLGLFALVVNGVLLATRPGSATTSTWAASSARSSARSSSRS